MRVIAFHIIILIVFIAGCSDSYQEKKKIREAVQRYNQLLIEGYKRLNMNPLQEVATEEQATKPYYHMAALGEADIRMHSKLKKIDFQKVAFPAPDKAVVMTREVWDFVHMDIKSGEKIYEEKDFVYNISYELRKNNGRWFVENVIAVSDEGGSRVKKDHPRLDKPAKK